MRGGLQEVSGQVVTTPESVGGEPERFVWSPGVEGLGGLSAPGAPVKSRWWGEPRSSERSERVEGGVERGIRPSFLLFSAWVLNTGIKGRKVRKLTLSLEGF